MLTKPYTTDGSSRAGTEIDFDTFLRSLPSIEKIWCIAFTRRYGIDFLYQNPEPILDILSGQVISLLDLLELSGICGEPTS